MKKVFLFSVAIIATFMFSTTTKAQGKIGSFDEESVLGLMPGIQKVDTILQKYVEDSLKTEYEYELSEYKRQDSVLKDSAHPVSGSLKVILQKELGSHLAKIQNWQQYQNQKLQQKQEELLVPYRQKIYDALREIIAEQKYVYVFKSEVFFAPIPLQDNLSIKVAQKLKLKLPVEVEQALKEQSSGAPAKPSAPVKVTPRTGGH